MHPLPKNPDPPKEIDGFPFCETCATWHAVGRHIGTDWPRIVRGEFWYGWVWGAASGTSLALVAYLIWRSA